MSTTLNDLRDATRAWFDRAATAGWLGEDELRRLDALESATPGGLFAQGARPLVAALFGGTGVGKSSLLNRLAGATIARVGVERPTSRELTLYAHEDLPLAALPEPLAAGMQVRRHRSAALRDVVWIDTPDIDSTQAENRALALACLPHVDLLVYVVSPERYRDDVGWRVLRERGHRHGWMFVLNRWDEGDTRQRADLEAMLRTAGFENPLVFCTACPPRPPTAFVADQLDKLLDAIRGLIADHGVAELERLGHAARLDDLAVVVRAAATRLGDEDAWRGVRDAWKRHAAHAEEALREGVEWPIATASAALGGRDASLLRDVIRTTREALSDDSATQRQQRKPGDALSVELWDDWARGRMGECVDALEVDLRRAGVASEPVRARLTAALASGGARVDRRVNDRVRAALARPGTLLQRIARRITGFATPLLPMLALLLVAWRVVDSYWRAADPGGRYLDASFAVHSALFVLIAWAVPFVADRMLRPSLVAAAASGLRGGFHEGLAELLRELDETLDAATSDADQARDAARQLLVQINAATNGTSAATAEAVTRTLRTNPSDDATSRLSATRT